VGVDRGVSVAGFDVVVEFDACSCFRQLILSIEPPPVGIKCQIRTTSEPMSRVEPSFRSFRHISSGSSLLHRLCRHEDGPAAGNDVRHLPTFGTIPHIHPMPRKPKKALAETAPAPFEISPSGAITSTMQLPTMASHPIVSGAMPMFTPHRPERP
jgi:hypothetical protein